MESKAFRVALLAIAAGLNAARDAQLSPPNSIIAEEWVGRQTPSRSDHEALMELLIHDAGEPVNSPDEPIDRTAHEAILDAIRTIMPNAIVTGQKASHAEWSMANLASDGYIFNVDSIDGVLPFLTLTFGYSTNILVYLREGGVDKLLVAALGLPGGRALLWRAGRSGLSDGTVHFGLWTDEMEDDDWGVRLSEPMSGLEEVKKYTVAALGADPVHRRQIEPLLDGDARTIFTTGGAPASAGLMVGALEALVATRWQALYDVVYLPMLLTLKIPVIDITDNSLIDAARLSRIFEGFRRGTQGPASRIAPPFVASRRLDVAMSLSAQLSGRFDNHPPA